MSNSQIPQMTHSLGCIQDPLTCLLDLVGRDAGIPTVVKFLQGIAISKFQVIAATDQDLSRIAQLLDIYADSKLDFVDASIVAIAERLGIQTILTIDQRDFRMVRPKHCNNFILQP